MSNAKYCSKCGETKPVTAFGRYRSAKDGLQWWCKECQKDSSRSRRASRKANGLCWCGEPAAEEKTYCQKHLDADKTRHLLRCFGLTPAQYEEMLEEQGHACKICRKMEPGGKGRWHIDHDHDCCPGKKSCGKCVRGLLCYSCNVGLGYFNDNPATLAAAIEYLTGFAAANPTPEPVTETRPWTNPLTAIHHWPPWTETLPDVDAADRYAANEAK